MTSSMPEGHISIIGTSYLYPITTLLESLKALEPKGVNELQASSYENGYAASIIALTVLLTESIVARVKKLQSFSKSVKSRNAVEFICATYPNSNFENEITELFIARDAIVHNHVWEAGFTSDSQGNMLLVGNPTLQSGYGDKKYRNVVDSSIQKTPLLKLNVYPTRISYSDVVIVLKTAVKFLLFLENEDRRYIYLSNQRVIYQGQRILFVDLVQDL